jgi:hypothetical protein
MGSATADGGGRNFTLSLAGGTVVGLAALGAYDVSP